MAIRINVEDATSVDEWAMVGPEVAGQKSMAPACVHPSSLVYAPKEAVAIPKPECAFAAPI